MSQSLIQTPQQLTRTPASSLTVREIRCNTLLHELAYRNSTGYTANLYRGCTHGCVYCYAPSLTHDERRWGTYVDAKVNAPKVLDSELRGLRKDEVFLSSASDPYQPIEAKYKITRECLKVLDRRRFPVSILTRSPLVLRDMDVLRKLEWVSVGMSITTVPVRCFEPGVSPLPRRIDTLRKLADEGIPTWVSLAPVIPGFMMVNLDELFQELSNADVSSVSFGILKFAGYEESRRMFEAVAGRTTQEVLAGQEELTVRLTKLVRDYGMEPRERMPEWKPESQVQSLDVFA